MSAPAWRCTRCLRQQPYTRRHGQRPTCVRCHEELRGKGLKWCGGCQKALPLAAFGSAVPRPRCRACTATAQRARPRVWDDTERAKHRVRALAHYHRKAAEPGYQRAVYQRSRLARARRLLGLLRGGGA